MIKFLTRCSPSTRLFTQFTETVTTTARMIALLTFFTLPVWSVAAAGESKPAPIKVEPEVMWYTTMALVCSGMPDP